MKATKRYLPVVKFVVLYKGGLSLSLQVIDISNKVKPLILNKSLFYKQHYHAVQFVFKFFLTEHFGRIIYVNVFPGTSLNFTTQKSPRECVMQVN